MTTTTRQWIAPGPGQWELDDSHQLAPASRQWGDLVTAHFNDGFAEGGTRYGLLLAGAKPALVDGWFFVRMVPIGGEKPGPMPPRPIFKLILALHPEMRRRRKTAEQALAIRLWHRDAETWQREGAPRMRARMRELQAVELPSLSDASLSRHIDEVREACIEGMRIHFRQAVAHYIGVGDWLMRTQELTGEDPSTAVQAFRGYSPSSLDTLRYLDAIAAAVQQTAGATELLNGEGDAETRLQALCFSSSAVEEALDAYLQEHGNRIFTGFDLTDLTLAEQPEAVLATIKAHLDQPKAASTDESYAAALRARVPAEHRDEYDELLAAARAVYGMRDSDVGPTFQWPVGLLRLALMEAGRRLAAAGRIDNREQIFEATDEEIRGLLSENIAVTAAALRARVVLKQQNGLERPPRLLGEDEGPPPPSDWLPPALARVNGALFLAITIDTQSATEDTGQAATATTFAAVKGLVAHQGVVTGRACVVDSPGEFSKLRAGDILVAPFTTPAYNVVLPLLSGVVTDRGGILSHAAIVAREYDIPAIVGTRTATSTIPDGATIRMDGVTGVVEVIAAPIASPV